MKVKYNANPVYYPYRTLTKGKVYPVISAYTDALNGIDYYSVINDRGDRYDYNAKVFDVVEGEVDTKTTKTTKIAELEKKIEDLKKQLKEEQYALNSKYVFWRVSQKDKTSEANDHLNGVLGDLSDAIAKHTSAKHGMGLWFSDSNTPEEAGIVLDSDYEWMIVRNKHGHTVLVCVEQ